MWLWVIDDTEAGNKVQQDIKIMSSTLKYNECLLMLDLKHMPCTIENPMISKEHKFEMKQKWIRL